ncbi:MAG TPA: MMPL family transporter [Candidatus Saccharimonadales bacterium]|nr:MMPL family transporter [Candidatus Saccharimonadales bacterium]
MFAKIARFSVRFRWFVLIFWIVAIPVVTANFPSITDVSKNNNSDFLPKDSPTTQAGKLENAFQSEKTATTADIVAVRSDGPLTAADNAAIDRIATAVSHLSYVTSVQNQGVSADGEARELLVGVGGAAFGDQATTIVSGIRTQLQQGLPPGLSLHLTGDMAESVDAESANQKGRNNTESYTVLLIIVLLLLVFRAVLAPLVTLLPAAVVLAVSQPVVAESTKIGVDVSFITQILLIVLILGAGTDYGLFLVFRMREELRRGLEPKEAVVKALSRVGESITFSAATVIAALLSLLLASFGLYKGLGPALAIALGIMLLAALTFLPALLAVLGRAVFWPSKTRKREPKIGLWGRVADRAIQRPWLTLIAGLVIFAGLAVGIHGYRTTGFGNESPPAGSDSAIGQQVIAAHFPAANNNPDILILQFDQPVWNNLANVQKAQNELAASSLFKAVSGPFNANGFQLTPAALEQIHASAVSGTTSANPAAQAIAQFISPDGRTVQFYSIFAAGPSGSLAATNATPAVRAELQKVAAGVGAAQNQVYGIDSVGYDVSHIATDDLERIVPVVLIIIALLLAIMLRSLVAPWYLIATVGLSYIATLGFAMIVFVHLGGQEGLNFILPFLLFIFGMALGQDYNILVMSRIREEAHKEKTLFGAVTKAIGVTGTTVTSAGLILAGTFTILGLVGGNQQVEQIGYSIAFGILLDTFFVRTLLVPSIVALLGYWNWWPSTLYHTHRSASSSRSK